MRFGRSRTYGTICTVSYSMMLVVDGFTAVVVLEQNKEMIMF